MKSIITAAAIAVGLGGAAYADGHANTVTLQLQWVTQSQFAGYYVAQDKGFYEEEGLEVTILSGGPDIAPPQVLAGGGADSGAGDFWWLLCLGRGKSAWRVWLYL